MIARKRKKRTRNSPLTARERVLLKRQALDAMKSGVVRIQYMGIRYLELTKMGWTPAAGLCDDHTFETVVVTWWTNLHPMQRKALLAIPKELA